jgi:hypothetical protein
MWTRHDRVNLPSRCAWSNCGVAILTFLQPRLPSETSTLLNFFLKGHTVSSPLWSDRMPLR